MKAQLPSLLRRLALRTFSLVASFSLVLAADAVAQTLAQPAQTLVTVAAQSLGSAIDAGALPGSQRLSLTLTLAADPARSAALDQFLTEATTAGSAKYHQWLTPAQFAAAYAPAAGSLGAAQSWAQSNGLSVDSVSPAGSRLTVSGPAARLQTAFSVSLRQYQIAGQMYFANATAPSLTAVPFLAGVDGLDNLPSSRGTQTLDSFSTLAGLIDANLTTVLVLDSALTAAALTPSHLAEYQALSRQAAAQGITLIAATSFPAIRPEILAIAAPGDPAPLQLDPGVVAARPTWQVATGLPAGFFRMAPDFTASSLAELAQAFTTLDTQIGTRQGNVAAMLYSLGPVPHLFPQADGAAAGTWETATGLGVIDLKVLSNAFPRATGGAQVQLQSAPSSVTHGTPYTLSAYVTSTNGGNTTPSGTVSFSSTNANFPSSVQFIASGAATYTPALMPGGTYPITAQYSGDGTYGPATGTTTATIQPEAANFGITAPASATLGASIAVNVTLTSASSFGVPTGSVMVTPNGLNGLAAQTQTLATQGSTAQANYTFTPKQAGTVSFQAACTSGDQSFTCYNQPTASTTIPQAVSTTTLVLSNSSPVAGTPITLSATVAGVSGINPTGQVQFFDNGTNLGSFAAPNATLTTTLQPGLTHSLTATYPGDTNYTMSTSAPATPTVGTDPTTTTAQLASASIVYGSNGTLTIAVAPTTGATINGAAPTGNVSVTGIGSTAMSFPLGGGSVVVPLNMLAVGTYSISVSYPGDKNYSASSVTGVVETVTASVATVTDMLSPTTFTTGSTGTLTVQITLPGASPVLPANSGFTATINGAAGAVYSGVFTVNPGGNTGTGSVTIQAPLAGSYTLTVVCATNATFSCTSPSPIALTSTATSTAPVSSGTTADTTVLTVSPVAPAAGAAVTLTATITAAATAITANPITGTVTFYDGTTALGAAVPVATMGANGVATTSVTLAGATMHSLTAVYSGSTTYVTSTSAAVSVTTTAVPAAIALTSSLTNGLAGLAITFTARVTGSTLTGVSPTGSVSFFNSSGPTLLGTVPLTSGGAGVAVASLTTTGLAAGSQVIYAVYSGDLNFGSVTSSNITLGLFDYNLTFTPQALTLAQGTSGQVTMVLGSIGNFAGTVAFGCVPPANALITCSFKNVLVGPQGNTIMTVATTAATKADLHPQDTGFGGKLAGATAFAALLCVLLPGGRRRRLPALLLVLLTLGLATNLGCSNNFTTGTPSSSTTSGTPLGTFIITVNTAGSDGTNTVRHNYSYQVNVQ